MLFMEFSQFVHHGHTKVDHNGVCIGFGEAAKVDEHLCHLLAFCGARDIVPPIMTLKRILILGLGWGHLIIVVVVVPAATTNSTAKGSYTATTKWCFCASSAALRRDSLR